MVAEVVADAEKEVYANLTDSVAIPIVQDLLVEEMGVVVVVQIVAQRYRTALV
jgi:hypothetical protein